MLFSVFFFFKQKTAYEVRISDWSSDVCSSDLADWFAGRWSGLYAPTESEHARRNIATGVSEKLFDSIGRTLTTIPADVEAHKTLRRVIDARGAMFADKNDGEVFDWATADSLAFGTLLSEVYQVRMSGPDSGRGPVSQLHPVWGTPKSK